MADVTMMRKSDKNEIMYNPAQKGIPNNLKNDVTYTEITSKSHGNVVLCYWFLSSKKTLSEEFEYLVLPDGCIDIVFDIESTPEFQGALIMTPNTAAESLNLGKKFSYAGIRLRPGAWLRSPVDIVGQQTIVKILAGIDLQKTQSSLLNASELERVEILELFTEELIDQSVIEVDDALHPFLESVGHLRNIGEYSSSFDYSPRHLQRIFKKRFGYSPHDFLKIIRFQEALAGNSKINFADQSHYIRDFKKITGMTPAEFKKIYGL